MGESRLRGRAGTYGFEETCFKGIGVIMDHLRYKRKWSKVKGMKNKVPYFRTKNMKKLTIKSSSSTPSCQRIRTRYGGKSEGWAWRLLAKWQTRRTKKDGVTSQHEVSKMFTIKMAKFKNENERKNVFPLTKLRRTKTKSEGHVTAWIVDKKYWRKLSGRSLTAMASRSKSAVIKN